MNISLLFKGNRRCWPIVIGGFFRSGTTLVRRLFDAHSQVFCGPEVKFWRDLFADYEFDPYAHIRFFKTARSLGLDEAEFLQLQGDAYLRLLEAASRAKGKRRWADKNPENLMYLDQWHRLLKGKFYFVFVVRHPFDALTSLQEIGFAKTLETNGNYF